MTARFVLTSIGADRPGLVDEVTRFILERGGNLEDSRMVNLRGQFAMVMLIAGDEAAAGRLETDLGDLERAAGIRAELTAATAAGHPSAAAAAIPYRLTTTAMDHPGLVQSVAHVLGRLGVNIESADTTLKPAPMTGAPLFAMELVVSVPAATRVSELRERLAEVCDDLNIDWQLTAL
ncbi:MAG: ACT domain-containing protein [Thermoleophilia bacterium]|jgi:glycine cleavage system transcriptional repressor|nr:ACT domain-containing protein [Thermoleophilia bacterium]